MTLDVELTAMENMVLYAKYYDVPHNVRQKRIKELLEVVGLADRADYTVGSYSGGMKRRLEIVRSLVHQPEILFLDEPTTGLRPASTKRGLGAPPKNTQRGRNHACDYDPLPR